MGHKERKKERKKENTVKKKSNEVNVDQKRHERKKSARKSTK